MFVNQRKDNSKIVRELTSNFCEDLIRRGFNEQELILSAEVTLDIALVVINSTSNRIVKIVK